jgi:hypothetical protein
MIIKLQFESEDGKPVERGQLGDSVIRAIDRAMCGAYWEANGEGWIARR